MKKVLSILATLFLFLSFANIINAQTTELGIRAGLNIANLSFNPNVNTFIPGTSTSSRMVFLVGGIFQLNFTAPISLEVEPTYIQKGSKIEGSNIQYAGDNLTVTYKLGYLEIPVLLRVNIPVQGVVVPYAEAGPTIGFNLSSSYTTDYSVGGQSNSVDTDNKDSTPSTEFGLAFGAGAEFSITPITSLVFDARYALGLSNLMKNQSNANQQVQNPTVKSNGIQLSLGVMFGM